MTRQTFVDSIDVTIADSFVWPTNKVESGHGEAKLYVGQKSSNWYREFFGPEGFRLNCRLKKSDLIRFLEEMKTEYLSPTVDYRGKSTMMDLWIERMDTVKSFQNEEIEFQAEEQRQLEGPRGYINSSDTAYELLRKLPLPNLSRLKIVKFDEGNGSVFEFKLIAYLNGFAASQIESNLVTVLANEQEKIGGLELVLQTSILREVQARLGQQNFRKNVLLDCKPICPFTRVEDEGLLIAGHIKPWAKSNDAEKLDPKNGMVFTPTYDRLFNDGLISFKDDRALIISPLLSRHTVLLLQLVPDMVVDIPLLEEKHQGRRFFLDYHRNNILRR